MLDIKDFHGQNAPKEELETVTIAEDRRVAGLSPHYYVQGSVITAPDGLTWNDFEFLEISNVFTASRSFTFGSTIVRKEDIIVGESINVRNSAGSVADYNIQVTSNTQLTINSVSGDTAPSGIVGHKKRYATKNLSKIVNVNGGNDITVNTRYEIDIATEIGSEYVGKQLIVEAEIYYDGSQGGDAGWKKYPQANWQNTNGTQRNVGLDAIQEDDVIAVYTAGYGGTGSSWFINGDVQNPWNVTDGNSVATAPCRVKVWVVDQYIVNLSGGGGSSPGVPTYLIRTENTSGALSNGYLMDVSSGGLQFTLPASPEAGDWISVGDYKGTCSILAPIVITSVSENIHGSTEDLVITNPNTVLTLSYVDATEGWKIVDGIGEGGSTDQLPYEEVVILPVGSYTASDTITLPDGYTWGDFEFIEMSATSTTSLQVNYGTTKLTKEEIATYPNAWQMRQSWTNGTDTVAVVVLGQSDTTATIALQGDVGTQAVRYIKGYTKYKPVLNRGVTTLWEGNITANGETLTFSESLTNFDTIIVETDVSLGTGTSGLTTGTFPVESLINRGACSIYRWSTQGTGSDRIFIGLSSITATEAISSYVATTGTAAITGVYGIKY